MPKKNDNKQNLFYTLNMDTKGLFSHSQIYAHARPSYPPELFNYLSTLVSCKERAWDCACGNGQAAIELAPFFKEVIATDINPKQLNEAFEADNIIYSCCPSEHTPFPDQYFDLITVAQALHWMDFPRFWPEVLRVLRPGGIFAAWGYSWIHHDAHTQTVLDEIIMPCLHDLWHPRNRLLWDRYEDIAFPFTMIDTPRFSIVRDWSLDELMAYIRSWSASQVYIASHGDAFLAEAREKLDLIWDTYPRPMRWDIVLKIGIKE